LDAVSRQVQTLLKAKSRRVVGDSDAEKQRLFAELIIRMILSRGLHLSLTMRGGFDKQEYAKRVANYADRLTRHFNKKFNKNYLSPSSDEILIASEDALRRGWYTPIKSKILKRMFDPGDDEESTSTT
jgi:hypothetical protein